MHCGGWIVHDVMDVSHTTTDALRSSILENSNKEVETLQSAVAKAINNRII